MCYILLILSKCQSVLFSPCSQSAIYFILYFQSVKYFFTILFQSVPRYSISHHVYCLRSYSQVLACLLDHPYWAAIWQAPAVEPMLSACPCCHAAKTKYKSSEYEIKYVNICRYDAKICEVNVNCFVSAKAICM